MGTKMISSERLNEMYVKADTLTTRIGLHDKYSINKYGWGNWVFDQYSIFDNMNILELGCGTGGIWLGKDNRLPKNAKIILSDFSPLMVQKAEILLHNNLLFSFQEINIQNIPYEDNTFDVVISNHMLYHVPDIDKALSEVKRVLKNGGKFYASTLGKASLKELNDIYEKLDDKASFSYTKNISFTLENGFGVLNKFFKNVEKRIYNDALEVTDIDDLIEYIKSYNEIPESANDELYRIVSESFTDGVFKIQKEQGLFVCTDEGGGKMLDEAEYWLDLADDDLPVAKILLNEKKYLHTGFFCHLITEKALKAIIACVTSEIPPYIHDLAKLAERGGIFDELSEQQHNFLKALNPLQIEARYPAYKERVAKKLTPEITEKLFRETEDFLCWTKKKLEK